MRLSGHDGPETHGLDQAGGHTCEACAKVQAGVMHWLLLRVVIAHDHQIAMTERIRHLSGETLR